MRAVLCPVFRWASGLARTRGMCAPCLLLIAVLYLYVYNRGKSSLFGCTSVKYCLPCPRALIPFPLCPSGAEGHPCPCHPHFPSYPSTARVLTAYSPKDALSDVCVTHVMHIIMPRLWYTPFPSLPLPPSLRLPTLTCALTGPWFRLLQPLRHSTARAAGC